MKAFTSEIPKFVADTHALVWHLTESPLLSTEAKRRFLQADSGEAIIYFSVMTMVEILYLYEKGRVPKEFYLLFQNIISSKKNESYQIVDFSKEVATSVSEIPRKIIPELPDRLITATAFHLNLPLITKDHRIQSWEGLVTIW